MDDAVGPTTDEYFTLTVGGPQTILNNSKEIIHVGDTLAWSFYSEDQSTAGVKRQRTGAPRRVGIRIATYSALEGSNPALAPRRHVELLSDGELRASFVFCTVDDCKIGRALTFARYEPFARTPQRRPF